jgi:hypothetical protein
MKISLYVTGLPVAATPMNSPWWVAVTVALPTTLSSSSDQVFDPEVDVGIDLKEHRPDLLEGVRPRRANRQWRADHRIRVDQLVVAHRLSHLIPL